VGIALFALHVAGALRHHILLCDGLIWRMMPARSPLLLVALPGLIAAGFLLGRLILPAPAPKAAAAQPKVAVQEQAPAEEVVASNAVNAAAPKEAENAMVAEPVGPPPAWTVQPGGTIGFSVGNGGDTIKGSFAKWTAKIVMDPDRPETADLRVEIDLASASVGDAYQDGMLAGDEFFGVVAHPKAVFAAKGAEKNAANSYRAAGTLTLKGVSKPQTIRFSLSGSGSKREVTGSASIARAAFGVGNGGSSTGLEPKVAVNFRFDAKAQ
jgi:polyisoprenoid-binding protein YceI